MTTPERRRLIFHLVNGRQYTSPAMSAHEAERKIASWDHAWNQGPKITGTVTVDTDGQLTRVIRSAAIAEVVLADEMGLTIVSGDA